MPPWRGRATAQRRTCLETKWRQRPPHTGQLRERTLLPLHACPASNPKTRYSLVAWTEFLNPISVDNSRRGQQPPLVLPRDRETTVYGVSSGDVGPGAVRTATNGRAAEQNFRRSM